MSTQAERDERKKNKPPPRFFREMESELVRLRAENARLREAWQAQDVVIRALLAERVTLGHREAEA